jgi:uncharacterized protein (TIGR02646 family)
MRPVQRGASPFPTDLDNYEDAKPSLVSRIGRYCSYCERPIHTILAVEHIQPKDLAAYQSLIGRWENFLLACVNCNSTKKNKDVALAEMLLPDRDNTFTAFTFSADGSIAPASNLRDSIKRMASKILNVTGLDKKISMTLDENEKLVALDRVSQRMQAWAIAEESRADFLANPTIVALRRAVIRTATETGFFSIWMTVFATDPDIRNRLIDAFAGTRGSGCFDQNTTQPVSPAPNPDRLSHGGKI